MPLKATKFPSRIANLHATLTVMMRVADRPANGGSLAFSQKRHDWVMRISFAPLAKAKLARTGAIRIEKIGAPSRANATVHAIMGWKWAALDTLQGKDQEVGSNDDADSIEDGSLHFVYGIADALNRSLGIAGKAPIRRTMFSIITTAPSTTMPKSSAPRESEICRNLLQIEPDRGE